MSQKHLNYVIRLKELFYLQFYANFGSVSVNEAFHSDYSIIYKTYGIILYLIVQYI